jgi:hypothetical protein
MGPRRRSLAAYLATALAIVVSGCGGTTSGSVPATSPSALAADRAEAQREAQRLLGLVPVPPGATPQATAPDALRDVPDRLAVDSLAVASRVWTLPMPYAEARAWIEAHPPLPLRWTVHGSGTGAHGPVSIWASDARAGRQARAAASLVGDGATSTLRVDGTAVWLDPTPLPDDATADGGGRRVRLTVAGGCPASDRGVVGVTGDAGDLDTQLLPGASPTAALLCRYAGVNGARGKPATTLLDRRDLDASAADRLANALRRLPLAHPVGAVRSCPEDDGSAVLLAFRYPGRADVGLRVTTSGCPTVANGRIRTDAGPAVRDLEKH